MKLFILLSVVLAASASVIPNQQWTAFDYHNRIGIPKAELLRQTEAIAEESTAQNGRIIGGSHAAAGTIPYMCGIVITLTNGGRSVCGSSLVSNTRAVTAAHCWYDGRNQALEFELVCGSITIYTGGLRQTTRTVKVHEGWNFNTMRNDVAIISLTTAIPFSNTIQAIALPTGTELSDTFNGETGIASGFGTNNKNQGSVPANQVLYKVSLQVMTNAACTSFYGSAIQASNICTSGAGTVGTCIGDSGGPLAVVRNGRNVLIGITSFGDTDCTAGAPSAFSRTASFDSWFKSNM